MVVAVEIQVSLHVTAAGGRIWDTYPVQGSPIGYLRHVHILPRLAQRSTTQHIPAGKLSPALARSAIVAASVRCCVEMRFVFCAGWLQ